MVTHAGGQGSLIGATIGGYQVEALIGRGAMGAVYLARDVKLNRRVALKVLLGSLARSQDAVKSFLKEAHTAAPLNHPGIVRIYSAGVEHGTPYIAMEFVDGEPLDRFMKRKGSIKWDVALQIGRKLANALDSAHKAGVVHRDIKPSNIMLDQKGGVRLTDFGIAAAQSDESAHVPGQDFLGTPQYMSPEQARGQEVTASGDLYSLGVTLYELISGRLPFTGESSMALINSICNDEAVRLNVINPEVPDDVARFVAYLMGKTPKDRPPNAKVAYSMMDRLQRLKGELSTLSDSLTSFLQDEMEVRPFQSLHQSAAKPERKETIHEKRRRQEKKSLQVATALRAALVIGAATAAFFAGMSMPGDASVDRERTIADVGAFTTRDLGSGTRVYQFADSVHTFSDVQWLGPNDLWLETSGSADSRAAGATGVIKIDLGNAASQTVANPVGPALDPATDAVYRMSLDRARAVSADSADDSAPQFLVAASDPATDEVVVLSREVQRHYADPTVLLRVPRSSWVWGADRDRLNPEYGHAVLSPGGDRIAYVLYNADEGYSYIVEQTRDEMGQWRLGTPRTSQGNEVIPGSLQYSRDGSQLFYMRRTSIGGAELWSLNASGELINGNRIRSGVEETDFAISADATLVAVNAATSDRTRGGADVLILQVQTGTLVYSLSSSRVGRGAFHPDGDWIVVNGYNGVAVPQLEAYRLSDAETLLRLTSLGNGTTESYAFSGNGQALAALPRNASVPSMLLIDWAAVANAQ